MSILKNYGSILAAATTLFLAACGGNEQKTSTETTTTDTTAAMAPAAPVSTIDTTPVNMMIVMHKVANYAKWKVVFDMHDSARLANGIHRFVIGRGAEDSNMVMVANKVDDVAKAKAFAKDPGLKEAMKKGGVMGAPTMMLVTNVFQDTAALNNVLRSMTMLTIKDWDAWKKTFDSTRQIRMDNGLVDRVVAHDAGDNHKVILVMAVMDTAKAQAFWKSDQLKQIREKGGIIGAPTRYNYFVAEKY